MYDRVGALPASRTDFVLESIKEAILSGKLKPGQALVETDLAATLEVSKTPVREALKTLAGSGLVVMSPYKGATVRAADAELARSVFDVRLLLEPEALRRSVELGADFAEARSALDDTGDLARRSLANRRFHRALYAGCGNPVMIEVLDGLRDRTALVTVAGWGLHPTWEAEDAEHRAILVAAEEGFAAEAADLLHRHVRTFADRVAEELADVVR
ncbi:MULTISPECIES: GntR family transcriptional regulator [Lentzea]|uniref:DNA-binding transcriptional regulator, GntR family n=1 Tax=Lentzea albida TaxID=65499 RepID=A0A1H9HDE7_9PSEU|nr:MULTISPECIES: GntR family transcriptional regulator [Lentzea]USX56953.1 GntR family transcriptional regulator [Lentzea sp. HUAS12]SEQ60369.1 DNA-binding transcriptional regulator, GntR family [Lentzea albida]